uniref:Uncharacterized protein n=1 Tax=Globisporangium ultimum (strain ATCC 200006 / CBS 805.95 / DAOM BR144) TaxID=431595 RepID=K3W823_GLOUD
MWNNASELDVASESDEQSRIGKMGSFEDVLIPCCSMKALHFWTRYYLRWDPTTNFGRDASIEIETLHRDLLLRFETLQTRVNNTKARGEEASKPKVAERRRGVKQLDSPNDDDDEEDEDDVIGPMFALDDASIPNGERLSAKEATILRPQDTHVVHLSLDQLLRDGNGRTKSDPQPESIHAQIERLKRERQESIEKIEAAFQEQLSRLMSQARAS